MMRLLVSLCATLLIVASIKHPAIAADGNSSPVTSVASQKSAVVTQSAASVETTLDNLFQVEPTASNTYNFDVDAFLSGKSDNLVGGFDARPMRHQHH